MFVRLPLVALILVGTPVIAVPESEPFPSNPMKAAKAALSARDYRLAGWGMPDWAHPGAATVWKPYGLTCRDLPASSFRYIYEISDAIGLDAANDYKQQKSFMSTYNTMLLQSGKLPKAWGCTKT